jgi:hypothetical protein
MLLSSVAFRRAAVSTGRVLRQAQARTMKDDAPTAAAIAGLQAEFK